MGLPRG